MIRPFTLIAMLLAAGSGAYLFAVKHRAQTLDNQLAGVNQKILLDAQRITVLQAQWALETDPTRLSGLARQFSPLQPMKPAQLVTLAALRDELPPPDGAAPAGAAPAGAAEAGAAEAGAAPADAPAPQLVTSAATPPAQATAAPGLPLPPPVAPVRVAAAGSSPARPAHPVSHSLLHLASTKPAETLPPPRIFSPQSPPPSQLAPQFVAMKAAPTDTGSVLGMAADLAPPRPLPQGDGN
jgi:hypothetical protein